MRAVVLPRAGGPDILRAATVPDPTPGTGEVLVRVRAAGVNRLDVWIRQGTYRVPLPHILGVDIAGELVSEAPSGRLKAGTHVLAYPGTSCGGCPACRTGRESLCPTFGIVGRERPGGYAELVALPESSLVPIPGSVPWDVAGAVPLTFLTAEHALRRAEVRAGETVVVFGASGGLGCALVERAQRRGARVLAVTRSPQHVPALRVLGADDVLMRGSADLAERILGVTRGRGADVVVDSVGKEAFAPGLRSLARGGRYVLLGATSGAEAETDLRWLYSRQLSVLGGFVGDRQEFNDVVQDLARGRLRTTIDRTFPLEQAAGAHHRLEEPHLGKLVLLI